VKPSIRIKSIGTKVSEKQFAILEARAHARDLTISEWVREELLKKNSSDGVILGDVLLAEIIASRTILLNLMYSISSGQSIKAEAMQELIRRTDESKAKRALELLAEVASQTAAAHSVGADTKQEREN
jgi:hypothetical protein